MGLKDRLRDRPVVGTAIVVQERYNADAASQFAAAIAYFGFLSLFPILLLAVAIAGYVFAGAPELRADLTGAMTSAVPGLGGELTGFLDSVEENRAAAGIVAIVGLLFAGFRVLDSATVATSRIFRVEDDQGFVKKKARDLAAMVVLGLLAVAGAAAASVAGVDVDSVPRQFLFSVGGTAVSLVIDVALFLVAYRIFAAARGPRWGQLWPGALLGGIGWTVLKILGSTLVANQATEAQAVYGSFATVVAIFFLLYLAARLYLYGAELNAVRCERDGVGATLGNGPNAGRGRPVPPAGARWQLDRDRARGDAPAWTKAPAFALLGALLVGVVRKRTRRR